MKTSRSLLAWWEANECIYLILPELFDDCCIQLLLVGEQQQLAHFPPLGSGLTGRSGRLRLAKCVVNEFDFVVSLWKYVACVLWCYGV